MAFLVFVEEGSHGPKPAPSVAATFRVVTGPIALGVLGSVEAEKRVRDGKGESLARTGLAAGQRDGQSLALAA